jgi:hypothetical protein
MERCIILLLIGFSFQSISQELQLNYDFRHSIEPREYSRNFPTLFFKYFKEIDTLDKGSFLLQVQAQLDGKNYEPGQTFIQVSQSLKFWKPNIYLSLNYSAGLGVTDDSYGYVLPNTFALGLSKNFIYPKLWISTGIGYRLRPSYLDEVDVQLNVFVGGGLFNWKVMHSASFVFWSYTPSSTGKGKKIAFFGDPQLWFGIGKRFSIGSRFIILYHILSDDNAVQLYPTLGIKRQFSGPVISEVLRSTVMQNQKRWMR